MGTNDKRKNFIDDDIFDDNIEEKINELYERTRQIEEINKNTPETDNEILKNINTYFSEIGIWDNTIDVFVETESYRKLEDEKNKNNGINPFDNVKLVFDEVRQVYLFLQLGDFDFFLKKKCYLYPIVYNFVNL